MKYCVHVCVCARMRVCVCVCVCVLRERTRIAQLVKNHPAMQETLVRLLGREDLLEKG